MITIDICRDIDRYCTVYQGNVSVIFVSLLKTTMGLQRSFKQFIYLSILNIQILTDNVDCRSVQYCYVLNDVFFERRANITPSTIYLSVSLVNNDINLLINFNMLTSFEKIRKNNQYHYQITVNNQNCVPKCKVFLALYTSIVPQAFTVICN